MPVYSSSQLRLIRRRFLESVSAVLLILAIFGLPLSLMRIPQTELNYNHICHICTAVAILVVFFLRRRLSDRLLVSSILIIFTALSLAAFLRYGIVSAGFYFAAVCIFVAGMVLGVWGGILCAVFYSLVTFVMAYLWMSGVLTFSGDVEKYISLPVVWFVLAVSFIIITAVFFVSSTEFVTSLKELVVTINNQKGEIERQTAELTKTNQELQKALVEVNTLSGLLPICAHCKKVRDDKGYWNQIESFIQKHSEAEFSHSICPECVKELYPELDLGE